MSRHHDREYRRQEALISRLVDNLNCTKHFRGSQESYLEKRSVIMSEAPRVTSLTSRYVSGYLRAMEKSNFDRTLHVRRIIGRPETATSAKWDEMTEEMRQACRDGHRTESCLAWDSRGDHLFTEWQPE